MRTLLITLLLSTAAYADAWDEFVAFRKAKGLPIPRQNAQMTQAAQELANFQAYRLLNGGHQRPVTLANAARQWREGTAASSSDCWFACCFEEDMAECGVATCIDKYGKRHMALYCAGGTGRALIPKEGIVVVPTRHLAGPTPTFTYSHGDR